MADLRRAGLAIESDGAVCVFPPGFKTKEGEPLPFIIQKSDGAYLYATTDLAALRYRINELKADRIVYVTDARQIQHFQMLFDVAEMAGWDQRDGRKIELVHVTFGSVLGEDGKPFKTRSGENVKLKDLLDEAVERAKAVVEEKNPDLPAETEGRDRRGRRHRGRQVRRLLEQPDQRLRLQLRQDAGHGRQHGPVHAVRLRPRQIHRAKGREQGRETSQDELRDITESQSERADGAGPRQAPRPLRGGHRSRRPPTTGRTT